jgi:hypothetical protein
VRGDNCNSLRNYPRGKGDVCGNDKVSTLTVLCDVVISDIRASIDLDKTHPAPLGVPKPAISNKHNDKASTLRSLIEDLFDGAG